MQRLEPALHFTRPEHLMCLQRPSYALDMDGAEIAVLEEIANQPACARRNNDCVRLGQGLQAGGEVGCFPDDRLFLRWACANQIPDDHKPGSDADARLEPDRIDVEAADSIDRSQL